MSRLITVTSGMSRHQTPGIYAFVRSALAARGVRAPTELAPGPVVAARVEHGRWLLDCPFCPSAGLGDPDDPRSYCPECRNGPVGGKWLPAAYPADLPAIEDALLVRPPQNRNWWPGESVADLLAENDANAAAIIAHIGRSP